MNSCHLLVSVYLLDFAYKILRLQITLISKALLIASLMICGATGGSRKKDYGKELLPEVLYDCYDIGGGQERCKVDECRVWFGTVKRGCIVR